MALHQQVFAALRGGAAPWFVRLLRRPEEVVDFTDDGRRKMPALMCGADGNYLALTHRQIDTISARRRGRPLRGPVGAGPPTPPALTPRNLTAQLEYAAAGNPASSRPSAAIANCCPGLEVDFRAVWRRIFKGIVLREYDNLVVDDRDATILVNGLVGCRLLRVERGRDDGHDDRPVARRSRAAGRAGDRGQPARARSRSSGRTRSRSAPRHAGTTVTCDFTARAPRWYDQQPWDEETGRTSPSQLELRAVLRAGTRP